MAKDSDRLRGGFDADETGGLSGLLADEDEFDRRTLWRLGTWAGISIGAVVLALVTNQSSIGLRREQTASADLMKQAQQLQLAAKESQNESRRLASAVDTLNSDRDRLYSRVAVLEQGLDSVTGAIVRQATALPPPQTSAVSTNSGSASASGAPPANSSTQSPASAPPPPQAQVPVASTAPAPAAPTASASTAPASTASVDPPQALAKLPAAPVVAPVAAIAPAVADRAVSDKQEKQASAAAPSEPSAAAKSAGGAQQNIAAQPTGSLIAPKSMMGPPDPAAGKLIEPAAPPKTVTSAPLPEIAAIAPKEKPEEAEPDPAPELVARRTEFGVDVGGANSVAGLRALWRGILKSRANAVLTTLRPIIVIKENNTGLGMQLRLVAGPINDAAAAAKICASLSISDRGCTTTVFEGQRLSMGADEQPKIETRAGSETQPVSEAKTEAEVKPASNPKFSGHHRYVSRHAPKQQDDPPKQEPSTLSRLFGNH